MQELKVDEKDLRRIFISDTPLARFWRATKKLAKQLLTLGVLYVAFFIMLNFSAYWDRFQYTVNATPVQKELIPVKPPKPTITYKSEVQIPKLGIVAPLKLEVGPTLMIESLKFGVAHYANSAKPGQVGNTVIVGHSSDYPWSNGKYKNVFALLDKLIVGDQIIVPYKSERYIYEVTSSQVVSPYELSVLKATNQPTLTLLTCYPVGTTRSRLIIRAKLVSNNAGSLQTTDPITSEALPRPR